MSHWFVTFREILTLSPHFRRVMQCLLYEMGAIVLTAPLVTALFDHPPVSSLYLSILLSTIAVLWNFLFNTMFEHRESRQRKKGRSLVRRLVHGTGLEGSLVLLSVPVLSTWLDIPLIEALLTDCGMVLVFIPYAHAFNWAFDCALGVPVSAQPADTLAA